MAEAWRQAWVAALDALETDVEAVEKMIENAHRLQELPAATPWVLPEGLGPLPLELRPRADIIMTRQLAAALAVSTAITANRRQTRFAGRVEVGTAGKPVPSYVDYAM